MEPEDRWDEAFDDNGITLGPEEALKREIEKSKALKIERLKLRDQIDTLRAHNARLVESVRQLEEEVLKLKKQSPQAPASDDGISNKKGPRRLPARWAFFLLLFNLAAVAALIFFQWNR